MGAAQALGLNHSYSVIVTQKLCERALLFLYDQNRGFPLLISCFVYV